MTRICRHDGCTRPAPKNARQCDSCRQRRYRERRPWESAWSLADETDVELIVESPRPVDGLTRLERFLVARGLTERDIPAEEIARVVGVSKRTVHRWRTSPPASAQLAQGAAA